MGTATGHTCNRGRTDVVGAYSITDGDCDTPEIANNHANTE